MAGFKHVLTNRSRQGRNLVSMCSYFRATFMQLLTPMAPAGPCAAKLQTVTQKNRSAHCHRPPSPPGAVGQRGVPPPLAGQPERRHAAHPAVRRAFALPFGSPPALCVYVWLALPASFAVLWEYGHGAAVCCPELAGPWGRQSKLSSTRPWQCPICMLCRPGRLVVAERMGR